MLNMQQVKAEEILISHVGHGSTVHHISPLIAYQPLANRMRKTGTSLFCCPDPTEELEIRIAWMLKS